MMNNELSELLESNSGKLYGKAVCLVCKKGELVFSHGVNCDINAVFDLASVSKIIIATLIFQLIGEGWFSLDQTLITIFKQKPLGDLTKERFKKITIQSLLTHSSGLLSWFPFYTQEGNFWEVLEIALNKCAEEQGMVYSDPGFMLLGEVVCAITGHTLSENLDILNKELGTSFAYNPQNPEDCVETERGNRIERDMCKERGLPFDNFRSFEENIRGQANDSNAYYFWHGVAGHAGIFGTAADLIKLAELYMNRGFINGNQLIPLNIIEKSTVDYGEGRGLMWKLKDVFIGGFGHTGFTGTSLYLCPEKGLAAALLTNRLVIESAPDLKSFRTAAHEIIYNSGA